MTDEELKELGKIVDNGTTYMNVGHIFYKGKDNCLNYFGEQDEECIKYNATHK